MALHLPWLPAERAARNGASLEAPLALIEKDRGALRLAAVNALAARDGVAAGMTLADARARLPDLVALPHDSGADAALLDWLAAGATRWTPMAQALPPAGLVLDITGCAHLHGGEPALVDDVVRRLARIGLTGLPALGGTPQAALALAAFQVAEVDDLPAAAVPAPEAVQIALRRAGLKTVGDLRRRERKALVARFGGDFGARLAEILGEIDSHIVPLAAPAPVSAEQRFAVPLAASDAALAVIEGLAVRAGLELTRRGEGGRAFGVTLFRADGHVDRLAVETAAPVRDPKLLIRLLREKIGALADPLDPGFGYDLIRLDVAVTAPLAEVQLGLEGGDLGEGEVGALVDRLVARLGRGRVRRLVIADSHIPEQAAFDLAAAEAGASALPAPLPKEPPWRPLQLLDPPQPIDVVAEVPDGPPRRFRWRRRLHDVTLSEGPERIASEWWRRAAGEGRTRDYYRVEDAQGRRYWLFRHGLYERETIAPGWYLHGLFA
ncbi:nucleotidyltransferase [alpha proteobacterium AAP81b]|nr:nucleotidyltransferase [alpha proteobacterium AAP81b]